MLSRLGRYTIKEKLGEGSFAQVYRALDEELEREVALKVLKPAWLSDRQALGRFKQEAKTMARLHHPHIATVYEVGEAEGYIYLAQFLVEGESLAARLARAGALPWPKVLAIIRPVASALDYAHGQGVVHRDIKPSNILLDQADHPYLGDFGLVRAAEGSASLSASTAGVKGTGAYIPPEVWEEQPATPASDVYALSCVVCELLTGKVLFEGSSMMAVMRKHDQGPQFPAAWPAGTPAGVTGVLRRGLAKDPAKRFQSAGELVEALGALKTPAAPPAKPSRSPQPGAGPVRKGYLRLGQWGWAVILLIVLGAGAFVLLSKSPASQPALSLLSQPSLAFVSNRDGNPEIYIIDETGQVKRITDDPADDIDPAWSPGRTSLVFASNRDGNWEIYSVTLASLELKRVTNNPADDTEPAWSPGGDFIAFTSDRDGKREVYMTGPTEISRVTVTPGDGESWEPAWGPNGMILFTSNRTGHREVYHTAAGGEVTRITESSSGESWNPNWVRPDGYTIFASDREGSPEVYMVAKTGGFRRMTATPGSHQSWEPASSPSGQVVAFTSDRDGHQEIYTMEAGLVQRVTWSPEDSESWSPAW